jgi:UDP-N-acetylmuramoyl-L-alanyl-D-glutamate--2,6-diaminopimelate ligase
MRLVDLVQGALAKTVKASEAIEVAGITADSRKVEDGSLFVAIKGHAADGHDYISDAEQAGAVAVVGERDLTLDIPYFRVTDSRLALAELAAVWHGRPAQSLTVIGITGTDGKTTTANLLHSILRQAGVGCGLITTVNAVIGEQIVDTGFHVTTPPPMAVQSYLARMVERGLTHCIIEATSHGLAQRRVAACEFDVAIVTNITHEHLDFHGSLAGYREAKAILFRELTTHPQKGTGQVKVAVLNRDDGSYEFLRARTEARIISYGHDADFRPESISETAEGLAFRVVGEDFRIDIRSPLHGRYNAWNCLAALAATVAGLGIHVEIAAQGIRDMESVPGRMEDIDLGQSFMAIVDFAHTPNALRHALQSAQERTEGRVLAVFGSAGLRDREKRRMMAEVAAEWADVAVITAEDPRTESLEWILSEMGASAVASGMVEGENLFLVPDRGEALRLAVKMAEEEDLVIALGKGHEQSMCFGEIEYPWDDRTALRAALAQLLGIDGPQMPRLPTSGSGS